MPLPGHEALVCASPLVQMRALAWSAQPPSEQPACDNRVLLAGSGSGVANGSGHVGCGADSRSHRYK